MKKKPQLTYSKPEFPVRSRTTIITKRMIGKQFCVYNGLRYITVIPTDIRINTKFGEYSSTRKFGGHLKKKKKK
jgi:small subunit ribosomal protein S19